MSELRFITILLAVTLLASCVSIERDNPDDPKSDNHVPRSSSAVLSSSSETVASSSSVEEREHYGKMKPQFTDTRDGKKYVYVQMGTKIWMAENLNYNASGSKCYNNLESNCTTYGRLYDWNTAKTACPSNWHLPTTSEVNALMKYVNPTCSDDSYCGLAGYKLKTTSGWNDDEDGNSGNGTDNYGFSALPGGCWSSTGFEFIGDWSIWWSSTYEDDNDAYFMLIINSSDFAVNGFNNKGAYFSVRCVRD